MYSNTFSFIAHVHNSGQNKHDSVHRRWWMGWQIFTCPISVSFFLVIEFKVEIRRVELVQTNVAVFAATSVRLAVRMESQRVDGAEMALDATEFLFEYQMEEASVEFADTRRSCGYVHGILATSKDHLNMEERAIEPNKLDKGE